jgi:membrane AbrB-like protein
VSPGRPARWVLLAVLTVAGTLGLDALAVPSAALFAGLVAAAALALAGAAPTRVPRAASVSAQAVVGVVIGVLAQASTLVAVARDWLPVLLVSSGTLAVSMAAGLLLGRRPGVSPLTGMLALTAGGASGLVAVSRDLGGDDRIVAVVQYLRVVLVTVTMPVVAATIYGASGGAGPTGAERAVAPSLATWSWGPALWGLGLTLVCGAVGVALARLLRVPAGGLLGPMTVALILTLGGVPATPPPALVVELAYAVIGWQAGVRFTRESLRQVAGLLPTAVALIAAVVGLCAALGALLARLTGATPLEGYLATTPGGIYAVLATAISSGVDVAFVVAVQVLRVVVMLLVSPAVARWVAARHS